MYRFRAKTSSSLRCLRNRTKDETDVISVYSRLRFFSCARIWNEIRSWYRHWSMKWILKDTPSMRCINYCRWFIRRKGNCVLFPLIDLNCWILLINWCELNEQKGHTRTHDAIECNVHCVTFSHAGDTMDTRDPLQRHFSHKFDSIRILYENRLTANDGIISNTFFSLRNWITQDKIRMKSNGSLFSDEKKKDKYWIWLLSAESISTVSYRKTCPRVCFHCEISPPIISLVDVDSIKIMFMCGYNAIEHMFSEAYGFRLCLIYCACRMSITVSVDRARHCICMWRDACKQVHRQSVLSVRQNVAER